MKTPIYFFFILLLFSCQTEPVDDPTDPMDDPTDPNTSPSHDQFAFTMTSEQLAWVFESRDTTYELEDPTPSLLFNADSVEVKKMKIRGTSASRVRRKSFNVDTEEFISFQHVDKVNYTESKDFRLLAMAADLCYIENRIGFGLLHQAELFPLFFKYVEVILNEETNGVYFLIENPNDYFLDKNDHAVLIRRAYYGNIDSYKYDDNGDGFSEQDYVDAFNQIYIRIKNYEGEELYNQLDEVLNVRQYMQKIGYDYLLKNGDYTDEIYLYDEPGDDKIQFNVIPWDLDDLFAELPHEIGNSWSTGNAFGDRYYATTEDVIEDVGEKLIFSIEDDLDYIIAKDPYLYSIYLEELEKLMNLITEDAIRQAFTSIEQELKSFFDVPEIVDQSQHDTDACDPQKLIEEINDKESFLINRRQDIIDKL